MVITRWLYVSILSAAVMLLVTAIPIDSFFSSENASRSIQQSDVLFKIFGQLRHDIGAIFYIKADEYYHGGTEHPFGETHHLEDDASLCGGPDEAAHEPARESPAEAGKNGGYDLFTRINRSISSHSVIHLNKDQSAELLPWFYLATLFDPQAVQAYVVGGFWLGMQMGKPEEGIAFLRKGLRHNPDAWELYAQVGELYFIAKKDYGKAAPYLQRAFSLMKQSEASDFDKKQVLVFLAAAMEHLGNLRESLAYYEQLSGLFNNNTIILGKIKALRSVLEEEPLHAR
ncbi:MAG: hypothetical protein PHO30_01745 [Candidatus Omnitrophica bacterium]|nr:hypothetical protein [Candidatus Omnitrophota bacterium]